MSTWSDSPTSEDMQKVLIITKGPNHTEINPKTTVCNCTLPD